MPKTSVKTKVKAKTHARSPFEPGHGSSKPVTDDSDVEMGDESGEEDEGKDKKNKDNKKKKEKDDAEKKLERMLFGDDEGFQGALTAQRGNGLSALVAQSDEDISDEAEDDEEDDEDDDKGLEDVADADLFFLDSGAGPVTTELAEPETPSDEEDEDEEDARPAVWHDSDDEQLTVSLADNQRLRKLRVAEAEDVISGKEYIRRLRRQYQQLNPEPAWARPDLQKAEKDTSDMDTDGDNEDDEDDEVQSTQPLAKLLQNATDLTRTEEDNTNAGGKRKLRQEVLDIQRLKDVGKSQPSSIDSLTFHPHYPVLLSSGPAATLFLHHISPSAIVPNPLLTSLHLRRTPIHTSSFAPPTGNKILASGRRRYFHIWDLDTGKIDKVNGTSDRKDEQKTMERFKMSPCGRYIGLVGSARKGGGLINVLDANTAQWIAQVRVEGRGGVADFAWWSDGNGMSVASKNGEISEWDARLNRVIARWMDAGAVGTTVIALGGRISSTRADIGGDRWVAVGSSSGVVNIYDRREWLGQDGIPRTPTPVRALDQLTTPISHVVFAPDGQFMVMASRWKRDALRLVHLPSCTVYRNWPTSNTPLGRISSVAVSPGSEHLAVANEQGRIRLWEIRG